MLNLCSSPHNMKWAIKEQSNKSKIQVSNNLAYYLVLAEDRVDGVNECGKGVGGSNGRKV